ncbi:MULTISPECIES: outer membrane beta-barrel protein [Rhodomicrobium]|uniref:outer membrane protein n=1 Tax=Rhodomicrobium TaxID=1068 RepID=UPI000B4BAFE5|nr:MULTISPECIES: outer membrane beta-barrel protein [Rhodomicrobium]
MRKLAVLAASLAFFGGVNFAAAADLSYKDTPYEAPLAPIWSGFYVGGHIGGLWNDSGDSSLAWRSKQRGCRGECKGDWSNWKELTKVKFSEEDDDTTLIGGVHVGYNWQDGARVYGLEADASFGDGIDYLASLRARLGYAFDNLLIYATAGVAFAGFDDTEVVGSFGPFKKSVEFGGDSEVGFVVGGGVEYKLASNWSIGVEGLYYGFGDGDDSKTWEKWCNQLKLSHDDDNDLFVARARLTYHFQDGSEEPLK